MNIKKVTFEDHIFHFTHGEYVMSFVTQTELYVRVLRLETTDGRIGWGEVIRRGKFDQIAPSLEEPILNSLSGESIASVPVLIRKLQQDDEMFKGLAFGLDTAYLDWTARKAELPMYALLGGRVLDSVPEYYSLSGGDAEQAGLTLKSEATGWKVVQIKLGIGDLQSDIDMVSVALNALTADQLILADFNSALKVDAALSVIAEFDDHRIVWEEPCKTIEENTRVAAQCKKPVMFDQCLSDLPTISKVATEGIAHSVCIKPPFLGGLEVAKTARDLCIEAGMPMRIDGPWCGHIATAANLHLACGVPEALLIAGCDLRQPLILDADWGGTHHQPGHHISPFEEPGHGVMPV